jgi:exodeoxyribonuclease-3
MRIATFNVNGIRTRLPVLLAWLKETSPDIVCLQELKATDSAFPVAAINEAGYGAIWRGERTWNGVAILAKGTDPIETRRELPGDPADKQSRYIEAAVSGILVGCLYLPNGNPQPGPKFDYKVMWFDRLLAYAKTLIDSGHPIVLAGDYNIVPTDADIYNPRSWLQNALLQPAVRERFESMLAQGWTDALRTMHSGERIYTFWDYLRRRHGSGYGMRIDHLLVSPGLTSRLRAADTDAWVRNLHEPSDHAPAWIELSPSKRKRRAL